MGEGAFRHERRAAGKEDARERDGPGAQAEGVREIEGTAGCHP